MTENDVTPLTRPWSVLAADYRTREKGLPTVQALADLCEYIEARPIRSGVHAWTSMWDLCIVQKPVTYPHHGPYLRILPLETVGVVEFRLIDTYRRDRQWSRCEPPEQVIDRFKHTMRQLNWFTDPSSLD